MKTKMVIVLLCIASVLPWARVIGFQTGAPAPKVQLPSGETVWDLNGDRDAFVENSGPGARHGTGAKVYRITQMGSAVNTIRTKDDPRLAKELAARGPLPWGRAAGPAP